MNQNQSHKAITQIMNVEKNTGNRMVGISNKPIRQVGIAMSSQPRRGVALKPGY
jgi:hypothetical protein